ncbi:MAG: adenylate/guanylate cyclase domain-containing protein [Pseudomonadota bacterium]
MADRPGHILIVDDNKVNRLLQSRSVELLGHQASVAENGRIAMQMLAAGDYDLMLLDIEMPEMDGFEVLEAIKADPSLRDVPVIVTSSVEGIDNVVRCIELGADDYLQKPVNKTLLRARLSSSLDKKHLRDEQKRLLERFATTEVAQDLAESGFSIGGRRVRASVLFCDLRGFTAMSETNDPENTIEVLNTYYTLMFEAVNSNGGVINQMIGDGLMALFGAPQELENTAECAFAAALEMASMMDLLNQDRVANEEAPLGVGIGIATGDVVAGYTGTQDRATYTCVGSTVNLAARLESHTKVVGCGVLTDAATHAGLSDGTELTRVPGVNIRGFDAPLDIYSL